MLVTGGEDRFAASHPLVCGLVVPLSSSPSTLPRLFSIGCLSVVVVFVALCQFYACRVSLCAVSCAVFAARAVAMSVDTHVNALSQANHKLRASLVIQSLPESQSQYGYKLRKRTDCRSQDKAPMFCKGNE